MTVRRLACLLGALFLLPAVALAQRPMSIVDLISVPVVSTPQISPDGTQVVYVQGDADWAANKRVSHLWRVRIDGTGAARLTSGENGETQPRWSPDGKSIAFIAKRDGDEVAQIYLLPMDGGEARRLTSTPPRSQQPAWSPDGRDDLLHGRRSRRSPRRRRARRPRTTSTLSTRTPSRRHLWTHRSGDARRSRASPAATSRLLRYDLSDDGRRHRPPPRADPAARRRRPRRGLGDGRRRRQRGAADQEHRARERRQPLARRHAGAVRVGRRTRRFETYYNDNLFVVPAGGGTARDRDQRLRPTTSTERRGRRTASRSTSVANIGVHSQLFVVPPPAARRKPLTNGNHAIGGWTYSAAQRPARLHHGRPGQRRRRLHAGHGGGAPKQVTPRLRSLCRGLQAAAPGERSSGRAPTASRSKACCTIRSTIRPGQHYPLVVKTHGGPQASDKFGFGSLVDYTQVLAGKGYAVLQAELPRQHRLRRRVPARHGRALLPERAPRRDGRRRRT